ncbi:hypothetical protein TBK1r_01750 [Stieleria magnilauensis]|uniref:Uncharacterized protein n=1 Tax=Stieleria magnilauensis TaxID=2527963 RepID=A0ABX5XIQ6_9BACT|nr:hypothetical protein TBK1r_01750 [Planctomycetes bacterium TBK1r]
MRCFLAFVLCLTCSFPAYGRLDPTPTPLELRGLLPNELHFPLLIERNTVDKLLRIQQEQIESAERHERIRQLRERFERLKKRNRKQPAEPKLGIAEET